MLSVIRPRCAVHGPREAWIRRRLTLILLEPLTIGDIGLPMLRHQVQGEDSR